MTPDEVIQEFENSMAMKRKRKTIAELKRRLGAHRRRLRYWSGLPSVTNYGPTGKKLSSGYMGEQYELAACDARAIAQELSDCGVEVKVIDILETFRARYHNPKADEKLIWPIRTDH